MRKILIILLVALLSACSRMYAPESQAPDYIVSVEGYLIEKIGATSSGGQVFCSYEVLDTQQDDARVDVYAWALCQEYYLDHNSLQMGTGSSLPVALHLEKAGDEYKLLAYEVPKDGMGYWSSIQATFTALAIEHMCEGDADCYNGRVERLELENLRKAREYYGSAE